MCFSGILFHINLEDYNIVYLKIVLFSESVLLEFLRLEHSNTLSSKKKKKKKDKHTTVLSGAEERGRRSQPGSFLFFTTPANLVLIFRSIFESQS